MRQLSFEFVISQRTESVRFKPRVFVFGDGGEKRADFRIGGMLTDKEVDEFN